jgi:hypothetical protein
VLVFLSVALRLPSLLAIEGGRSVLPSTGIGFPLYPKEARVQGGLEAIVYTLCALGSRTVLLRRGWTSRLVVESGELQVLSNASIVLALDHQMRGTAYSG